MNYRHVYHAGNFGDVLKHIVLLLCLDYLQKKDGPLCIIDAHGGAGEYDLASEEALKTQEWEKGVGRLWPPSPDAPDDLALYLSQISEDMEQRRYPGSPLLISRRLRPSDALIASELHEETFETLEDVLRLWPNARILQMDAYQCIRAHIPPKERRGLVLIDPPFEKKDEFETLARQMAEWKKRWTTGVYLVWYPIKAHLPVAALKQAARDLGLRRTWFMEALVLPRDRPESFNGSGVIVFNAPYTVPERVEALAPVLKDALKLHGVASGWLTED
jgi:23S rRNA (adenine2030-N6)-methyltransferase